MTESKPNGTGRGPFDLDLEPASYEEALRAVEAPSALALLEAAGRASGFLRRELTRTLGDACDESFDNHPLIQLFAWRLLAACFGDLPKRVRPTLSDAKQECRRRAALRTPITR